MCALPPSAGFIRFCSAFMAGPEHGFPHYTFLVNEESNDVIPVTPGRSYGADPAAPAGRRQAGYAVYARHPRMASTTSLTGRVAITTRTR